MIPFFWFILYKIVDIYNLNSKLYNVAINFKTFGLNCEKTDIVLSLISKTTSKKHVQNYLKENRIEISKIIYPTSTNGFESISGSAVMNVPVIIEGKQDGKDFSKKVNLDFYFVVTNSLRTGTPEETSPSTFEIMGVNISSDKKELNGYNYHFDYENAVKDFGIN